MLIYRKFPIFSGFRHVHQCTVVFAVELLRSIPNMYTVSKSIRVTKAAEGAVLLAIEAGKVLRLNPTGLLVLERLQNGATEGEIVDAMTAQFQIAREIARSDVTEFLQQLHSLGLVEKAISDRAVPLHSCDGQLS